MFLVEYFFAAPERISPTLREKHLAHLAPAYADGSLLIGGPLDSGKGGLVLSNHSSVVELVNLLDSDPFVCADLASYQISEFHLKSMSPEMRTLLDKS